MIHCQVNLSLGRCDMSANDTTLRPKKKTIYESQSLDQILENKLQQYFLTTFFQLFTFFYYAQRMIN